MAQPTKPAVTSVWASTATDNVTPTDAFIAAGWPLSTTPPSRGRFNWLLNYLYNGIRYFSRRGIPDYDAAETYMTNDRTMGPDGLTYVSLVDNNTNHAPASSPTQWARWGFKSSDFGATLSGNGYQKLPNGMIMQWGSVGVISSGSGITTQIFSLPIACPNAHIFAMASFGGTAPPTQGAPSAVAVSNSQVEIALYTASAGTYAANYLSIGY